MLAVSGSYTLKKFIIKLSPGGRVWIVILRLGTGKLQTFFYSVSKLKEGRSEEHMLYIRKNFIGNVKLTLHNRSIARLVLGLPN
jgi:hypothetical protein